MKPKKVQKLDYVRWRQEVNKLSAITFPQFTQPFVWNTRQNILNSLRLYLPMASVVRSLLLVYQTMAELDHLSPSGAGIIRDKCDRFSNLYMKVFEDQTVYREDYDLVVEKALDAAKAIDDFIRLNKPFYDAPCRRHKNLKSIMDDIEAVPKDLIRMIRHIKEIIQQTHTDR